MALSVVQTDLPPSTRQWEAALASGEGFQTRYVPSLDMVAITLGEPRPAYAIDGEDGAIARIDLETNEVIGLELYDCRARFLPQHPEFQLQYLYASNRWFRRIFDIAYRSAQHRPGRQVLAADTARAAAPALRLALSYR